MEKKKRLFMWLLFAMTTAYVISNKTSLLCDAQMDSTGVRVCKRGLFRYVYAGSDHCARNISLDKRSMNKLNAVLVFAYSYYAYHGLCSVHSDHSQRTRFERGHACIPVHQCCSFAHRIAKKLCYRFLLHHFHSFRSHLNLLPVLTLFAVFRSRVIERHKSNKLRNVQLQSHSTSRFIFYVCPLAYRLPNCTYITFSSYPYKKKFELHT